MSGFLNRFTTLPVLIDMLANKRITLISPEKWEDRNDAYYIEVFKNKMKYNTVLGICFSSAKETFHHWKIYASGMSGVCIEFDKDKLIDAIIALHGVKSKVVSYKWIMDARKDKPKISDLPFLKRKPYEDEEEFRIIYSDKSQIMQTYDISITPKFINKITLSPFLPKTLFKSVETAIWNIEKCDALRIVRSTLLENEEWKKIADET